MATCGISVDHIGAIRPKFGHPFGVIGTFLDHDVQRSIGGCDDYLECVRKVAGGEEPSMEFSGNAHEILIVPSTVSLRCNYDEDALAVTLRLSDSVDVLKYWRCVVHDWQQKDRPRDYIATREFEFPGAKVGVYPVDGGE